MKGFISVLSARRLRRRTVGLTAVLVLVAGAVAVAAPSGLLTPGKGGPQGLIEAGPVNPAHGFPDWYRDTNGVDLAPCLDPQDPNCGGAVAAPDNTAPIVFPDNFPNEFFYKITDGLKPDTDYKVTHPYGTDTVRTDAGATGFFVTEDVGVSPGDFNAAPKGRVGPFLQWAPNPADPTDATLDGPTIGTALVDPTGAWKIDVRNSTVAIPACRCVSVESERGGEALNVPMQ
jgi:hypothetical protein